MIPFLLLTSMLFQSSTSVDNRTAGLTSPPNISQPSEIVMPQLTLKGTTLETFSQVVHRAGFSGGIARVIDGCSRGPQKPISIAAGLSLAQALDLVAGNDTNTNWRMNAGVINMLPVDSIPLLLQYKVHQFEWDPAAPVTQTIGRLRDSDELAQTFGKIGMKRGAYEGGGGAICIRGCTKSTSLPPKSALQIEHDITVLDLLNKIVKSHSGSVWAYSENHCGKDKTFLFETIAE